MDITRTAIVACTVVRNEELNRGDGGVVEEDGMVGGSGGGRGGGAPADLHSAARSGDLAAVQSIISSNPLAVNSRDKHSRTPYPFFFLVDHGS